MVDEITGATPIYSDLAVLLSFPTEGYFENVRECLKTLSGDSAYSKKAAKEMDAFIKDISELTLDDLQGIYSYTFELTADYTLDLGYFLFEGFKRTNFLVSLKQMYKANNFPYRAVSKGELPDNMVVLLKFLADLEDGKLKKEFRETILIKAVEKLAKNLGGKKDKYNQYGHLIRSILAVIDADVKKAA